MKKLLLMLCFTTQFIFCADHGMDDKHLVELALCSVARQLEVFHMVAGNEELEAIVYQKVGISLDNFAYAGYASLADLADKFESKKITNIELYDKTLAMAKMIYDLCNECDIVSKEHQQLKLLFENMNMTN